HLTRTRPPPQPAPTTWSGQAGPRRCREQRRRASVPATACGPGRHGRTATHSHCVMLRLDRSIHGPAAAPVVRRLTPPLQQAVAGHTRHMRPLPRGWDGRAGPRRGEGGEGVTGARSEGAVEGVAVGDAAGAEAAGEPFL